MFTTDTTILRRAIADLELGRRAMMAAPAGRFIWCLVGDPACGAPGCCWGFTEPGTKYRANPDAFGAWTKDLGLPLYWGKLTFWMRPFWRECPSILVTDAALRIHRTRHLTDARDRDRANHLMKLLVDRLRHRLAVCEVEQGEWGRQRRAVDLPVGLERENAVAKRETICA